MNPDERQEMEAQRAAIDEQMTEIRRWASFWSDRFSHTHIGQPIGGSDKSAVSALRTHLRPEWCPALTTSSAAPRRATRKGRRSHRSDFVDLP
jgi:hypothetical protein